MLIVLSVPKVDFCFTRTGGTKEIRNFFFPKPKRNPVTELEEKNQVSRVSSSCTDYKGFLLII